MLSDFSKINSPERLKILDSRIPSERRLKDNTSSIISILSANTDTIIEVSTEELRRSIIRLKTGIYQIRVIPLFSIFLSNAVFIHPVVIRNTEIKDTSSIEIG
jgi:hypothetical protein